MQVVLDAWDPVPLDCGWCYKTRFCDAERHHIREQWHPALNLGDRVPWAENFQCYKLCWLAPGGGEGDRVGLTCETPAQEDTPPNPEQPCGVVEGAERAAHTEAVREWMRGADMLEGDDKWREDLRTQYYRYLVHDNRIVPEGFLPVTETFLDQGESEGEEEGEEEGEVEPE